MEPPFTWDPAHTRLEKHEVAAQHPVKKPALHPEECVRSSGIAVTVDCTVFERR